MSRVIAVVEGQTEQAFVRGVLAPWLGTRNVFLSPCLVGKPGRKGGVGPYLRAKMDILNLLKQESDTIVTTMFDFYGMPTNWPRRDEAAQALHDQKASIVEDALKTDINLAFQGRLDPRRFIPYVQMYEFEALLFSKPEKIAEVVGKPKLTQHLQDIRNGFDCPEQINDDPSTAPSKRIARFFPKYQKLLHGSIAAERIGIEVMLAECPHFQDWLCKIQAACAASRHERS